MSVKSDILSAFVRIAASQEDVRMINDYRGIPVSYGASIVDVREDSVNFCAHKYQCICLDLDRFTYIQSPSLNMIVKGRVANLDIASTIVTLSSFERASETIGRRTMVRVQPKEPLNVMIIYQDQKIRGSLADISSSGVGIFMISAYIRNPGVIKKSEVVQILIRLPGEKGKQNELRLLGTITYVNPDRGAYRLGLNINPEAHTKALISRYVNQRQEEILRDLRIMYDKLSRGKIESK